MKLLPDSLAIAGAIIGYSVPPLFVANPSVPNKQILIPFAPNFPLILVVKIKFLGLKAIA